MKLLPTLVIRCYIWKNPIIITKIVILHKLYDYLKTYFRYCILFGEKSFHRQYELIQVRLQFAHKHILNKQTIIRTNKHFTLYMNCNLQTLIKHTTTYKHYLYFHSKIFVCLRSARVATLVIHLLPQTYIQLSI